MKKAEIEVGSLYVAKVNGRLTTVRVDAIRERESFGRGRATTSYQVTNQRTGRKTMFRSAAKFRSRAATTATPTVNASMGCEFCRQPVNRPSVLPYKCPYCQK